MRKGKRLRLLHSAPITTAEKATENYGRPFQIQKYHASQGRAG